MKYSAQDVINQLNLEPLLIEGGFYRRTYLSREVLPASLMLAPHPGSQDRNFCSAIYFLLTPESPSRIHRLASDEIFHFYLGDPVEMWLLNDQGRVDTIRLGNNIFNNYLPQVVVTGGIWQGSRLEDGGDWALLGTTMSPSFHIDDFEVPVNKEEFVGIFPLSHRKVIRSLL